MAARNLFGLEGAAKMGDVHTDDEVESYGKYSCHSTCSLYSHALNATCSPFSHALNVASSRSHLNAEHPQGTWT